MTKSITAEYERAAVVVFALIGLWLITAVGIGIALFSDREAFLRDQAIKRALAEQREAEREFGPVIPTSFNL